MRYWMLIVVLALGLGGCVTEPWVKPYEREMLTDPIMSFSSEAGNDRFRQHVYDVLQGSQGAEISQGGGCGCK